MHPASGPSGRSAVTGLAVAALVFLTACASGGSAAGAHGASLAPRQALRAAETDARHLNSVVDTFSVRARGASPETITGITRYQLWPTLKATSDIHGDLAGANMRMRTITTDTALYMNIGAMPHFPGMSRMLGKPWIKFGLAVPRAMAGAMAGLAEETQAGQGASISVHLRISQLATNVHVAGTQLIGGVPTTEYAGSYRVDKVFQALSADERKKVELDPLMKVAGSGPVYFREWIDGQRHLRKLVEVSTSNGTTRTSTDYFTAFNQPVHVTLPPASQTLNLFGF